MIDVKVIFGINVKKLRNKLNLSQDQFSEKISIAPTTLSIIESGKGFTTAYTINKVCNTFNLPASSLFETDSRYIVTKYGNINETVNDIILKLYTLDDDKLILTANFIQMLSNDLIETIVKQKL